MRALRVSSAARRSTNAMAGICCCASRFTAALYTVSRSKPRGHGATQRTPRVAQDSVASLRGELGNLGMGEDDDVAGLAAEELLLHRAHRAEAAGDLDIHLLRRRGDEALRGARAHELQAHHWSAFAPEIFTMRAHLSMS